MSESGSTRSLPIHLAVLLTAVFCSRDGAGDTQASLPEDVVGGWRVFTQKHCIQCHAIWNVGGQIGPDLGRTGQEHLTASDLGGTMWNHIPRMHSHMLQSHVAYPVVSVEEMSDLFSLIFFVGSLEESGSREKGERILLEKGCVRCHLEGQKRGAPEALSLERWGSYANPIVWAQKMWEHAPRMEEEMKKAKIAWPQFDDTDLVDLIAYVRSLGKHEEKVYLEPGSARTGSRLFAERRCRSCHVRGGRAKDLAAADLPHNLSALATRMWNHSPEMARMMGTQGVERSQFTPQEMADIIAYILALRNEGPAGEPERGRQVFLARRCTGCHKEEEGAASGAPPVARVAMANTPVRFAQAMWNHGGAMLDAMSELGSDWPVFQPGEVADLIAYLRSIAGDETPPPVATSTPPAPMPPVTMPEPVASPLPPIQKGESCVSDACHSSLLAGREVHVPVAQGECESCHAPRNLEQHQFELISETSDLCYVCHDEPVQTMHAHGPVSVTVCTACHEPHSSDNALGPGFTGQESCYADIIGMTSALATLVGSLEPAVAPSGVNPPLPSGDTTAGSPTQEQLALTSAPFEPLPEVLPVATDPATDPVTASQLTPPSTVAGGCTSGTCHVEILSGPQIHVPAAQQQCDACHRVLDEHPHRFELTAREPDLCYQCHDQSGEKGEFIHGPLALGLCTPCHSPHSAPHKNLLPESGAELCFICHSEMATKVQAATVKHEALTGDEKGCLACHSPHRSEFKFQLRNAQPELCYECHPETGEVIKANAVSHAPVTTEKKCGNCHDVHGSGVDKLLVDTELNLCLGCHNRPMTTPHGPIVDMKSWIESNPEHHGPIREGICASCHLPHGSEHFRILRHPFPADFYRPFEVETYALCFQCHEETIVLDPRTTTLTAFRNGDKNLHYVHVNREKGRTCRACHEIHAGTQPKRMKDFVPFGRWKYPLNFEATKDGGRCRPGCHVPLAYSRVREIIPK